MGWGGWLGKISNGGGGGSRGVPEAMFIELYCGALLLDKQNKITTAYCLIGRVADPVSVYRSVSQFYYQVGQAQIHSIQ